jgi:AcrR family transcriptional regulator
MTDCAIWKRLGRPSREEAEQLTDKVLDTALGLFAERGYGATSIGAIAADARVGKHTIYRRYPDKAALFRACIERTADQILGAREEGLEGEGDPLARLKNVGHRAAAAASDLQMVRLYRMIMAEAERFPELAAIFIDVDNDRLVQRCAQLIRDAQALGLIRDEDPVFLASMFLEMTAGTILHGGLGGRITDTACAAAAVEGAWRVFLFGAGKKNEETRQGA